MEPEALEKDSLKIHDNGSECPCKKLFKKFTLI